MMIIYIYLFIYLFIYFYIPYMDPLGIGKLHDTKSVPFHCGLVARKLYLSNVENMDASKMGMVENPDSCYKVGPNTSCKWGYNPCK